MSTLPPSGLAPTLPPAPRERARRALLYAVMGLALLVLAVFSQRLAHNGAAHLFAYDNDSVAAGLVGRTAFGLSLAAQIAALNDASATWARQRHLTGMALLVTALWVTSVAWMVWRG